jgi:hypothetical protein
MIGGRIETFKEFENKLLGLYYALGNIKTEDPRWNTFHTHLTSLQSRYPNFNDEFEAKYTTYAMFEEQVTNLYEELDKLETEDPRWNEIHTHLTGLQVKYPEFNNMFWEINKL